MTSAGQPEGAWMFVSHSHYDLVRVRIVRNALEAKGHNPLLFFLKCLDDDSALPDLIRREIEARTWFILCDSPNAKVSKWVQDEVEIIKSLEGKVYEVIDLDDDLDAQLERVSALSSRATVYISYTRADEDVAQKLKAALFEQDFRIFDVSKEIAPDTTLVDAIVRGIEEAVEEGFVLVLLSPAALERAFVQFEYAKAVEVGLGSPRRSAIVPVIVRDREATLSALPAILQHLQYFDLTTGKTDERIAELISNLKTREMEPPTPEGPGA